MDRANSKHSRWLDDQMARETLGYRHSAGAGLRRPEWLEPEPPAEGQPQAAPIPDPVDENERLSQLGRFVPRTALPGDRDALLIGAARMRAPEEIMAQLGQLQPGHTYATVAEVWAALGHRLDRLHR
jgi:hypothetical protein